MYGFEPKPTLIEAMRQALTARGLNPPAIAQDDPAPKRPQLDAALEVPGDPAHYAIDVPGGIERDLALEETARRWFHKAGLPQGSVNGIIAQYCRHVANPLGAEERQRNRTATEAELRRGWGADYDRKLKSACDLVCCCGGGAALSDLLEESGLGDDVWFIRTLAALGQGRSGQDGGNL